MFVDLVGLTALASGRDPEELRELIQVYQNTVVGEITRFEGHIAKFLGDGVLAYFGWPRAHEDEAERGEFLVAPDQRSRQTCVGGDLGDFLTGASRSRRAITKSCNVSEWPAACAEFDTNPRPL